MAKKTTQAAITISLTDLEAMMRRVVRQELVRNGRARPSILEDWSHEGPEDPEGDEELLQEALILSERYKNDKTAWKSLEEIKQELANEQLAHAVPS